MSENLAQQLIKEESLLEDPKPISQPTTLAQWEGGLWKIASCACFAVINGIVRYLTGGSSDPIADPLSIYVIVLFQNIFGTLFMIPWLTKKGLGSLKTYQPALHVIRVTAAVVGIGLWYLGLYYMPIAQAVALSFTGPMITVLGAKLLLNEELGWRRSLAMGLSFTGAFIILRPDAAIFGDTNQTLGIVALLPLLAAVAFACSKLSTRKLGTMGESAQTMTIYLLLMMTPFSLVPALFTWVTPSLHHWPWLILLGGCAAGAHFCLSKSFTKAEITFVTPFGFSKIMLSAAVGYFAFAEFPNSWSMWLGAAVIFASVVILSTGTRRPKKQKTQKTQPA